MIVIVWMVNEVKPRRGDMALSIDLDWKWTPHAVRDGSGKPGM
jgi:hypothetical protein